MRVLVQNVDSIYHTGTLTCEMLKPALLKLVTTAISICIYSRLPSSHFSIDLFQNNLSHLSIKICRNLYVITAVNVRDHEGFIGGNMAPLFLDDPAGVPKIERKSAKMLPIVAASILLSC